MEANLKEHQITFSKGMSNIPSDNLCDDNCLSDCIGMRMRNGELRPIQNPKNMGSLPGKLKYIHKMGAIIHYIAQTSTGLGYFTYEDSNFVAGGTITSDGSCEVTAVGNVLVLRYEDDMKYALWKSGSYLLINGLPEVEIATVHSGERTELYPKDYNSEERSKSGKTLGNSITTKTLKSDEINAAKDEVVGLIEGAYDHACELGYFTYPFWIRCAIKLYDGSYTMVSNPVLVMPTVRRSAFVEIAKSDKESVTMGANMAAPILIQLKSIGNFEGLEDIISGISIFISDQVKTWSDSEESKFGNQILYDYIDANGNYKYVEGLTAVAVNNYGYAENGVSEDGKTKNYFFFPPSYLKEEEIKQDLLNASVFYKIADVKPNSEIFKREIYLGGIIGRNVLENLTTQEQLPHDDYYGHAKIVPKFSYSYNGRLQIADIMRFPFEGFSTFVEAQDKNVLSVTAYVKIESKSGTIWVAKSMSFNKYLFGTWFYYPDPNATEVIFVRDGYWCSFSLTPHPRLNGAYFFNRLPDGSEYSGWTSGTTNVGATTDVKAEQLKNSLYTSDVNNPWIFNAEGDNTIGTGEIQGIVANTRAISQGQFGQHPLIVFTTEGIYALGVNSEGLYATNYPMSREVCNNPDSITPTDGAVFFTSEKGLMMMVGAEITCVSQQMMGKSFNMPTITTSSKSEPIYGVKEQFLVFLRTCKIAYDYKDDCLYIFNPSYSYHYIYDIASGAITRNGETANYKRVVNDYPDNLIQDGSNNVYSLMEKKNVNEDDTVYSAQFLSRPVKFSDAQSLKSLRQIKHVMDISGNMGMHIYVSNDLKHWGEITSLRGSGWKYFRFGLQFTNLKATDSYSGMICITQTKRFNKLR